ncbi:PIN-like domain-containing protein [Vibrio vulnificus]|uniref:PIN-like domain-containing protein n=1 Tax=Vibrio vulnificus TaxID=672 RepID=UPI0015583773|nr:PIN-like domain-containing protein [Vibrio vulnificus]
MFKGFHNLSEESLNEVWNDENTLFVFDTNVLLNLYGYAQQTRDDFFKILDTIDRKIWIPYHVGLEYQRRRLDVVKNEKAVFNDIERNLDKILSVFKGDFEELALRRRFPKLADSTEKLQREISKSISDYKKSVVHWNKAQPCVRSHDPIRQAINDRFDGCVGDRPKDQKWLDDLYIEGKERFAKKIPPGFCDSGKSKNPNEETHFYYDGLYYERQYGDLILWKQLIDRASHEDVHAIVFVTDDAKDDWWFKINSNGKKQVGPLAELQAEIYREANINKFHMYSTSQFLEDGNANLQVDVDASSIVDANTKHHFIVESEHEKQYFSDINVSMLNNDVKFRDYLKSIYEINDAKIKSTDKTQDFVEWEHLNPKFINNEISFERESKKSYDKRLQKFIIKYLIDEINKKKGDE